MFDLLRADINEARKVNVAEDWWSQNLKVYLQPGTQAVIHYRYRRWAMGVRIPILRQLLGFIGLVTGWWVAALTGVDISPKAELGPGFVVHTAHGVVVGEVKVGRNCIVQNGVVLTHGTGGVGDNVYFGAGAKVIGHARIGNNVVVVANSLVMTHVPDNTTVVGVPARHRFPRGSDDHGRSITRVVTSRADPKPEDPKENAPR